MINTNRLPEDYFRTLKNDLKALHAELNTLNILKTPSVKSWLLILKFNQDIKNNFTAVQSHLPHNSQLENLIQQFQHFNPTGNPNIDIPQFKSQMISKIQGSLSSIISELNDLEFPVKRAA